MPVYRRVSATTRYYGSPEALHCVSHHMYDTD